MKRRIICLSAILLTFSVITGCADKPDTSSSQESITETTEPAEPQTEATTSSLVEIDPFEGLDPIYYYDVDGNIMEKTKNYSSDDTFQENDFFYGENVTFVYFPDMKGLDECSNYGCDLEIYRNFTDNLKEGDKITYTVAMPKYYLSGEEMESYIANVFGIKLTRTTIEVPIVFEEIPAKEYDPFEEGSINIIREKSHYRTADKLYATEAAKAMQRYHIDFRFDLSCLEGNGLQDLYAGDKIKYTLVLKDGKNEYTGEDINKYLEEKRKPVRLTQTEKTVDVFPTNTWHRYSANVNVNLNRSDDWYQIVSNKGRFSKYDFRHIDGSTATIPITAELLRQFCGIDDSVIEYYIDHNTTGHAYENLITGFDNKNLIIVTEPSDEELEMAAEHNVVLDVTPVALDGFVFITHKDNPVDSLTLDQIRDIYSGAITNWSDVGGYDEEIMPYLREKNSGSQTAFENMVMQGTPIYEHPDAKKQLVESMGGLIEYVSSYQNETRSIGYTFNYYLNNLYKNSDVKVIKIDGVAPDNENLIDGSYPLTSGYYAVTLKGRDRRANEIRDYLISDEGQEIIELAGYCPIR